MSSTDETTPVGRMKQVRARLDEIGPYPAHPGATTAAGLARRLSVRAAVISHQQLGTDAPFSHSQIDRLTVLFAAAHALYALNRLAGPDHADSIAREIRDAWDDGSGIGEWLWDHLGSQACAEIGPLADELAALEKPSGGLLAHADTIRMALEQALMDARSGAFQKRYRAAIAALEDEIDKQGEGHDGQPAA